MKKAVKYLALIITSSVISVITTVFIIQRLNNTADNKIASYYAHEMATVVSPQAVKKYLDEKKTDYILVDLRSQAEYEKEHIKSAVNIPATSMNEDQLIAAFKKLGTDKQIIVHCYSGYCTLGRQVGNALAKNGIFVKEMTAGWSEWRYHWDLWNPGASNDAGKDYIVTGKADSTAPIIPCTVGEFGC